LSLAACRQLRGARTVPLRLVHDLCATSGRGPIGCRRYKYSIAARRARMGPRRPGFLARGRGDRSHCRGSLAAELLPDGVCEQNGRSSPFSRSGPANTSIFGVSRSACVFVFPGAGPRKYESLTLPAPPVILIVPMWPGRLDHRLVAAAGPGQQHLDPRSGFHRADRSLRRQENAILIVEFRPSSSRNRRPETSRAAAVESGGGFAVCGRILMTSFAPSSSAVTPLVWATGAGFLIAAGARQPPCFSGHDRRDPVSGLFFTPAFYVIAPNGSPNGQSRARPEPGVTAPAE